MASNKIIQEEHDNVRLKIIEEISKTEKLILEYKDMTQPIAPDVAIGRISRMDAINNKSVMEAALRQAEKKLANLKRVLSFHGTSNFGRCHKCKCLIPTARLIFLPESMFCIKCAK